MKKRLEYIIALVLLWAMPLSWIVITYLVTVPTGCRPNMPAFWACFWIGYFGPPVAFLPIGIGILLLSIWLINKIIKAK